MAAWASASCSAATNPSVLIHPTTAPLMGRSSSVQTIAKSGNQTTMCSHIGGW